MSKYILGLWSLVFACTLAAPPYKQEQIYISPIKPGDARPYLNGHHDTPSMKLNLTFDDINLRHESNRTLTNYKYLAFDQINIVNTTGATEKGFWDSGDEDCAVSYPNALHGYRHQYPTPSVIRSDPKALASHNLSQTFDLLSFTIKPLRADHEWSSIVIGTYRLEGPEGPAVFVDGIFAGWGPSKGFLDPLHLAPNEFWPGWGERINWIEIEAYDGDLTPWEFCLDNLELRFHADEEDEHE